MEWFIWWQEVIPNGYASYFTLAEQAVKVVWRPVFEPIRPIALRTKNQNLQHIGGMESHGMVHLMTGGYFNQRCLTKTHSHKNGQILIKIGKNMKKSSKSIKIFIKPKKPPFFPKLLEILLGQGYAFFTFPRGGIEESWKSAKNRIFLDKIWHFWMKNRVFYENSLNLSKIAVILMTYMIFWAFWWQVLNRTAILNQSRTWFFQKNAKNAQKLQWKSLSGGWFFFAKHQKFCKLPLYIRYNNRLRQPSRPVGNSFQTAMPHILRLRNRP